MKEKSLSSLNGLGTLAGALLVALAGAALFYWEWQPRPVPARPICC